MWAWVTDLAAPEMSGEGGEEDQEEGWWCRGGAEETAVGGGEIVYCSVRMAELFVFFSRCKHKRGVFFRNKRGDIDCLIFTDFQKKIKNTI